ncbi:polysaccharide deacetylase family protein [Rhodoferax sp.]|uniref:polysaccharide deacetylase family protein n=1 Tax=Rhodoferax sp. TaxID=50421 RepID=UPI00374DB077
MFKTVLKQLAPAGARGRLSVLIFHRVLPQPDPIFPGEVDAAAFDAICQWMKSWCNVLPLDLAVQQLQNRTLPERAAAITFDDGYADNRTVAQPILVRHGLPASFFIATDFLDGGRMWNDTVIESVRLCRSAELDLSSLPRPDGTGHLGQHAIGTAEQKREAIAAIIGQIKYLPVAERLALTGQIAACAGVRSPDDLMLTSQQVREMRHAGMQIGAHTRSHPILAKLGADAAQAEIAESRRFLEQLLGERVGLFAYPNGKPGTDYSPESVQIVRDLGFDAAVSTTWGASRADTDPFQIPRFTPWDRSKLRFGGRLAGNLWRS